LVGLVCFYGAHYVSFYRDLEPPKYSYEDPKWKIYDDSHIEQFYSWTDVVKRCVETIMRPTILFYQRVDKIPTLSYSNKIYDYELREFERIIENSFQFNFGIKLGEDDIKEQERLFASFSKGKSE
jgi:hypothetical protein